MIVEYMHDEVCMMASILGMQVPPAYPEYVEWAYNMGHIRASLNDLAMGVDKSADFIHLNPQYRDTVEKYMKSILDALSIRTAYNAIDGEVMERLRRTFGYPYAKKNASPGMIQRINEFMEWVSEEAFMTRKRAQDKFEYEVKIRNWITDIGTTMVSDWGLYTHIEARSHNFPMKDIAISTCWLCMVTCIEYDMYRICEIAFKELRDIHHVNSQNGRDFNTLYDHFASIVVGYKQSPKKRRRMEVQLDVSIFFGKK